MRQQMKAQEEVAMRQRREERPQFAQRLAVAPWREDRPHMAAGRYSPADEAPSPAVLREPAAAVRAKDMYPLCQRDIRRDIEERFACTLDSIAMADRDMAGGNCRLAFSRYTQMDKRLLGIYDAAGALEDSALPQLILRELETLRGKMELCRPGGPLS
jgi:hypothetical protein